MDNATIRKRILNLREDLHLHNHQYYVLNQPEISDIEYDRKMEELIRLEQENPDLFDSHSPSVRVGSDLSQEFNQIAHIYPMLSLGNTYSEGELKDFCNRVEKLISQPITYVCELKFDGTAISLTYANGRLLRGVTRGDGVVGDDVTQNIKTIKSIPLQLSGDFPSKLKIRVRFLCRVAGLIKLTASVWRQVKCHLPIHATLLPAP